MKRKERRHLKENEIGIALQHVVDFYDMHRREANLAGYVLLAVLVVGLGVYYWHQRTDTHAEAMLAQATAVLNAPVAPPASTTAKGKTTPPPPPGSYPTESARLEAALPKLEATANAYPSTQAGIAARYQQGAALMGLGHPAEAVKAYQAVIDRAGDTVYGQMARLGIAEAQVAEKQYNQAITTFRAMSLRTDGDLPVDGILMELGQTYIAAGRTADAVAAFKRIVQEFPESPYAGQAQQQINQLTGSNG